MRVQQERELEVQWRPFSLAIKNGELTGSDKTPYAVAHVASHRVLRVIEAVAIAGDAKRADLYTAFGKAHFIDKSQYSDNLINSVLAELGLNSSYLESAEDTSIDARLQSHLADAIDVVGEDVGVPTIIFEGEDGGKTGFFGPVITELPSQEESLKLWDGLSALASNTSFYELKRSRSLGPSIDTTKVLFEN